MLCRLISGIILASVLFIAGCGVTYYDISGFEQHQLINPENAPGIITVKTFVFEDQVRTWFGNKTLGGPYAKGVKGEISECLIPEIQGVITSYAVVNEEQIPDLLKNKPVIARVVPTEIVCKENFTGTGFICKIYGQVYYRNEKFEIKGEGSSGIFKECFTQACEDFALKLKSFMKID